MRGGAAAPGGGGDKHRWSRDVGARGLTTTVSLLPAIGCINPGTPAWT